MAVFDDGTRFQAVADQGSPGAELGHIEVEFSVRNTALSGTFQPVTALEIAQAIDAIAQAKGYQRVVFRGPQARAELNP